MPSYLQEKRTMTEKGSPPLPAPLAIFGVTKTLVNTGYRMIYPFLPIIARGLGVNLETIALAVTGRFLLGLSSPFLGSLADFRGRKQCILMGSLIFSSGFLITTIWPTVPGLWITLLISSLGKIILDPAIQAYLGDHVDYARRGRAVAMTELSWSAAALIGIPVVGWLISRAGWAAPFPALAGLIAFAALAIALLIPSDSISRNPSATLMRSLGNILQLPQALFGISLGMLMSAGNEAINIVYGAWMEKVFMIDVIALGAASAVIGIAEFGGESLVALFADRISIRLSIGIGISLNACIALALPYLGGHLNTALLGLFLFYITFEIAIVSSIPMMTELVPHARATMMSSYMAGIAGGRAIGSLAGSLLFGADIRFNTFFSAAADLLALLILLRFLRD
jgi:predicted MFS family arabinose efflux permease